MKTIYAFGDIHGMYDQLDRAIIAVENHASTVEGEKLAVFLGDYVDRGLNSFDVVQRIKEWNPGFQVIHLKGNHEDMLVNFALGDPDYSSYINNYPETIRSYNQHPDEFEDHIEWMRNLPLMHKEGKYVFAHAGIRPKKSLEAQTEHDLLWIRHDFLMDQRDYGFIVVHGHTPYIDCPHVKSNRINLDSACFSTGRLTVGILNEDKKPDFIQIEGRPSPRWET